MLGGIIFKTKLKIASAKSFTYVVGAANRKHRNVILHFTGFPNLQPSILDVQIGND